MPENQNFRFSTGVGHPAQHQYTPKTPSTYRRLTVTRAVAGYSDYVDSLSGALGLGTNGVDFDNSGKNQQENIFVKEASAGCPRCGSDQVIQAAGTGPHHASLRCGNCDRFIKWISKPKVGGAA